MRFFLFILVRPDEERLDALGTSAFGCSAERPISPWSLGIERVPEPR